MSTRLDRLLQLLSTGSTPLVRQTAARQLGHVASIRIARVTHSHNVSSIKQAQAALSNAMSNAKPSQTYHGLDGEWEEIVNLLVKVLPFLRSKDWETRSAAALAIESILKAVGVWHPPEPNYQDPVQSPSSLNGNSAVKSEEYRPLAKFDLVDIVSNGTKLLASSGREFAGSAAANTEGKHDIVKAMGLAVPGAGDQDFGLDVEDELRQGQADEQKRQSHGVKGKGRAVDTVSASSSQAPAQADVDLSKLSARERNALKRKRKAGNASGESSTAVSVPGPPQKVRLVAGSPSTSRSASPSGHAVSVKKEDVDEESYGDGAQKMSQTVTIAYKGSQGGLAAVKAENQADQANATSWMPAPDQWPFTAIATALQKDLLHQKWEYRHGACLGLRELIRTQGRAAGMSAGSSAEENSCTHALWCENMAESILQVFALDRFGDFVGDHVVAPVRETASQTLSALLLNIPPELAYRITHVLVGMVAQSEIKKMKAGEGRKTYFWEVKHAGLMGLKYLAAVRQDMFTSMQSLDTQQPSLQTIVDAAVLGLEDTDDDVRGVAAAALVPLCSLVVKKSEDASLSRLLYVVNRSLNDQRDDLSSSVGNVMDLLGTLLRHQRTLDLLSSSGQGTLANLVFSLFPFFRHTISSVRIAVIGALNTLLSLPARHVLPWIDERVFRIIYQNLIVEERLDIRTASLAAWSTLLDLLAPSTTVSSEVVRICGPHLPGWLDTLMTPVGTAVNTRFFWKSSAAEGIGFSGVYDVDKPVLLQDMALVSEEQTLQGRLAGATALALLFSRWPAELHEANLGSLLIPYLTSSSSHQITFASILFEEWSRQLPDHLLTSTLGQRMAPLVTNALQSEPAAAYSETSGLLAHIYTLCTQFVTLLKNKGKVPAAQLPRLIPYDQGFTLGRANQVIGEEYAHLLDSMKEKTRNSARPALDELQGKIQAAVGRAGGLKESEDIRVFASLAGAAVALHALPAKLNPVIRSLTNSIKSEMNIDLQARSANALATFIYDCTSGKAAIKVNPVDKLIKNICSFLCQDTKATPLFSVAKSDSRGVYDPDIHGRNAILPVKITKGAAKGTGLPDAAEVEASGKASLVRRGAESTLKNLAHLFGNRLLLHLPKLWSCMSEALALARADQGQRLLNDTEGQDLLDCLTVFSAMVPILPSSLSPQALQLFPNIVQALQSQYTIVRHLAAKSLAVVCDVNSQEGMRLAVQHVLPFIADPLAPTRRRGAVEAISHMVAVMDVRILPYVIFLIVPILGRMTDADDEVRLLATNTFATLVKLVPLEAGLPDPPGFTEELILKRAEERDFLVQLLDGSKVADYKMPVKVAVQLRKYQQEGVNWLAFLAKYQLHGILCDDMGLGKTLQTICILASKTHERAQRHAATSSPDTVHLPSLVVCPPTLTGHWQQEVKTYADFMRAQIYTGDRQERNRKIASLKNTDVLITSYDVVRNDIDILGKIDWNYCILDEGHIIKNGKTKLSKAVKSVRANHRLILSGTPIQNNVLELWNLFDFLMPGFLGTEESFARRFGKPIQRSRDAKSSSREQEAGTLALEALHKQVLPFLLRRLKEDVLDDLPPKIIQDYYCDLSALQRDLYESYTEGQTPGDDSKITVDGEKAAETHVFQTLQYLRKLVNHPTLVLNDSEAHARILRKHGLNGQQSLADIRYAPKLLALQQLLIDTGIGESPESANNGVKKETYDAAEPAVAPHRVLIFCQQKQMLDLIEHQLFARHMPTVSYMRMDGSTPANRRHGVVQTFNADPSIDVLLLTTHVGGLGLNLTGADTVIFVEHDWNPSKDLQAMDRAHRLGQKRTVNVYRLITRGTLEEKIMGLQRFKMNIASSVVNEQNADMASMDTENVLDLFALGEEDPSAATKRGKNGPISQKALLDGLQELDDTDNEYKDLAGDVQDFAKQLQA